MGNHLMSTYKPLPVNFSKADGIHLWDESGKKYLDALCGISVTSLGHNHPAVTATICEQAKTLLHTSNLYGISNQQKLADRLCELSGMDKVFFGNSGAEANEAAIKLARLYGHQNNISDPQIIVMEQSFHGRTMATLSATGSRKVQAGFEPLVSGFLRAPYNNVDAIETIAANNKNVVAILVEPIQGESGINIPDTGYLKKLRQICDQNNWLLMLDEIQSGMARSGQMFAFQHEDIQPDVMTLAKALGNGIPIGACLAAGKAAEVFSPGKHGSTFGGNPFCSKVALTVVNLMVELNLAENAQQRGKQLAELLTNALAENPSVKEIRHQGLLFGITMDKACGDIVGMALEQGLLINVTAERVIRLLPPLIINQKQTNEIASKLIHCIQKFTSQNQSL